MSNKNKIASGIWWTFAEKILTEVVNTIISIVLARLLFPSDYGLIALIQIFINISSIFVSCGFGTSLVQRKHVTDEQESTIFYVNIFIGIIIYLVLFILAPNIATLKNEALVVPMLRVLGLKIPLTSIYSVQHAHVQKRMEFKKFFYSSLFGTIISGVVGIVMAYQGFGPWALIVANLTDQIFDMLILFYTTKWLPKFKIALNNTKDMIKFDLKILLSELITRTSYQLSALLIGLRYSTSDLAYYNKGSKFPQSMSNTIDSIIIKVMFPVFSEVNDDPKETNKIIKKSIQVVSYILIPTMFGLAAVSNNLISVLLTDKWLPALPFMIICCFQYSFHPIFAVDDRVLHASGRTDLIFKLQAIGIPLSIITLVIAVFVFDNTLAIAVFALFEQILYLYIETSFIKKITGCGFVEHIKEILSTLVLSSIMLISVYVFGLLLPFESKFVVLALQIIFGMVEYLVLSIIIKPEPYRFIIGFIKNKLKS